LRHYQSLMVKSSKTDNENATEVSYRVSYHSALAGEVHSFAETIINHVQCQCNLWAWWAVENKNLKQFSYLQWLLFDSRVSIYLWWHCPWCPLCLVQQSVTTQFCVTCQTL
jgi:hypothetical protein